MPPDRVVMITPSQMRTDARICREAEALHRAGFAVDIVCLKSDKPAIVHGPRLVEIGNGSIPRGFERYTVFTRLLWTTLRRRATVYHAHNVYALPIALIASRMHHALVVYDAHELFSVRSPAGREGRRTLRQMFEALLERRLAPLAGLRLTASRRYAQQISQAVRISPPVPVPNFPELPVLVPNSPLRGLVQAGDNDVLLLYQGGFYLQSRALEVVIRAMPLLPPIYHLVLLGFGVNGEERVLAREAEAAGVMGRVTILPSVPHQHLSSYTQGADVGLIPFRLNSEAMQLCSPNKLYEYLGAGLPVVSADAEELAEVLAESGAGITYDYSDPADFADKVQSLGISRADLRDRGSRGRVAAETSYSWEVVEADFTRLYRDFVDGRRDTVGRLSGTGRPSHRRVGFWNSIVRKKPGSR